MKRWSAMAKTFTRIGKDIVMAVKEGGPNPESNARLRAVMQNAKAANMPKENVERAIKKASDKNTANYKEVLFEGYAAHGIALLVETATDNNNRTVANVRAAFNKCDGTFGTSGSVVFMFDHTCNFRVSAEDLKMDLEEFELELIDFEVEEVFEDEDGKMNLALDDVGGAMLVVSQFTLYGDCRKGRRPSFMTAAQPKKAEQMYGEFVEQVAGQGVSVATGRFRADMQVSLTNDGPVTLWIDTDGR